MTSKQKQELLELLHSRLSMAKVFSKKWRKDVKKWMKDYEIDTLDEINFEDLHNKIQVPYIFSTIESALPSMFERVPNILMLQRGKLDKEFTEFADQVWDYVKERVQLEDKIEEIGMLFLITGLANLKWGWDLVTETVDGPPNIIEVKNDDGVVTGSQEIKTKIKVPVKDDPFVRWYAYDKIYFSPESRFVMDDVENEIPYIICENNLSKDEVEFTYNLKPKDEDVQLIDLTDMDIDDEIDMKSIKNVDKQKVSTYEYYGILPKKYVEDENWRPDKVYYCLFIKSDVTKPEPEEKKPINLIGNYGVPGTFHKFGEPKVLRELEQDVSLGRSRIADIRDKYGQKIAMANGTEVDEAALRRPADFTILRYIGNQPPVYLNPPPLPETIMIALSQSRQDIQMASAQLDLSRGGSQSVVNTATGQQIFAEATGKRIDRKRRKIAKFLKYLSKNLLKLCALNWEVEKFAQITDRTAEEIQQAQFIEKLARIGEDYDIRIDIESVSINKETMAAQAIALYREVKDDPNANASEALKEALKIGFGVRDFDRFLSDNVSPEQVMKVLEYFIENQIIPQELGGELAGAFGMFQQEQQLAQQGGNQPNKGGRPATDGTESIKNGMPAANSTQLTAQTAAAGQQANNIKI